MIALSLALCFLGSLAFAAFWLWLRRPDRDAPTPGSELAPEALRRLDALEGQVSTLELQRGITRSGGQKP